MMSSGPSVGQDTGPPGADPWCSGDTVPPTLPGFNKASEPAIKIALQAEAETISLITTLPEPMPRPARNQLDAIADLFKMAGLEVIQARTFALRSIEPDPQPDPYPARRAQNAIERALLFANLAGKKIEKARERGEISGVAADKLLGYKEALISNLPDPLP